jgi:rare lipoprotein A
MYAMTAAHRTLPLASYAEVTNLKNHRSVIVRINDRGPYHGKRALDLSYAAAKELGISGLGSVQITPLRRNQSLALLGQ